MKFSLEKCHDLLSKYNLNELPLKKWAKFSHFVASIVAIVAFFLFFSFHQLDAMLCCILIFWFFQFCFALSKLNQRMAYTLFLASFFCFLLGRMAMDLFTKGTVSFQFGQQISEHMLLCIMLALIFLQVGFALLERWQPPCNAKRTLLNQEDDGTRSRLQRYAKWLFYPSAICALAMNIEQIIFIQQNSYLEIFKTFSTIIPRPFQILGNAYIALFFVYLATCPRKKESFIQIAIFLAVSVSILLAGDRGTFIINIAAVLVYIFWRQFRDNEVWIRKKWIILGACCVPFVIAGLSFFVYLREGVDVGEKTFLAQFERFFNSTGNTVDLLGYGKQYQQNFPQHFYSFGELIDYIKYNPISSFLFGFETPPVHTPEYATSMHSYSHMISYLIDPESYVQGHGRGSCYLAEAFHDFGYFGVVVCNVIYGAFMAGLYKIKRLNSVLLAAVFIGMRILYYTPRGPVIVPISYVLNLTTLGVLIGIWILAKYQPLFRECCHRLRKRGKIE